MKFKEMSYLYMTSIVLIMSSIRMSVGSIADITMFNQTGVEQVFAAYE